MKKMNKKQLARSFKENLKARRKMMLKMWGIVMLLFFVSTAIMYATGDATKDDFFKVGGGTIGLATIMGAVGDIDDPTNAEKVGKQVKAKLYLLSEDQYDDTQAFPTRTGREVGNIPLKAGEHWHYIKAVLNSPEPKSSFTKGDIASTIANELTFIIGGMDDATLNLLETGAGAGFYIVWEICSTGDKYLGGNGCKPLELSAFTGGPGKDNTSWSLTFKNECGELWSTYTGNTPVEAAETVAEDATTITLTDNPRYQLTDGSVSAVTITEFTAVTLADINRIVTILGSGGTYPSLITSANDFLLIGGVTWTALAGKQISFKIFEDGTGTYKFVEVSGSRV
jgi:hypothetical protein